MGVAKIRKNSWIDKLKKKVFPTSAKPQPGGMDYSALAADKRRKKVLKKSLKY